MLNSHAQIFVSRVILESIKRTVHLDHHKSPPYCCSGDLRSGLNWVQSRSVVSCNGRNRCYGLSMAVAHEKETPDDVSEAAHCISSCITLNMRGLCK